MRIKTFDVYQYALALNQPLKIHETDIEKREGFVIHLTSDEGGHGFGEVAPLPGLNQETLRQSLLQTKLLKSEVVGKSVPPKLETLDGHFHQWLKNYHLKPSVQFGFEMAVLNLISDLRQKPLYKLIGHETHEQVEVNALFLGPTNKIEDEAKGMVKDGFRSMKLKVGDADIQNDIVRAHKVLGAIGDKAILRLDANQKWDLKKAVAFGSDAKLSVVEYIEEPFANIEAISEFFMETTIPVALDESLAQHKLSDLKSIDGLEVVILKPTFLGGIEKCWQLIQEARSYALQTVISSSFETSIGLNALANLAGCSNRYSPAGLDTIKWFKDDLISNPLTIKHGKIDISNHKIEPKNINFNFLEPIHD